MHTIIRTVLNEKGSTLVIGVLALVVLSLIGVAATTTSRTEVEIAGNDRTVKQAFYAAEYGLTSGEVVVETLQNRLDLNDGTTTGHYKRDVQPYDKVKWQALKWNDTDSVKVSSAALPQDLGKMAAAPRYIIAERNHRRDSLTVGIGVTTGFYRFNVTSHGTGGSSNSDAVVRSVYAKRYN